MTVRFSFGWGGTDRLQLLESFLRFGIANEKEGKSEVWDHGGVQDCGDYDYAAQVGQ